MRGCRDSGTCRKMGSKTDRWRRWGRRYLNPWHVMSRSVLSIVVSRGDLGFRMKGWSEARTQLATWTQARTKLPRVKVVFSHHKAPKSDRLLMDQSTPRRSSPILFVSDRTAGPLLTFLRTEYETASLSLSFWSNLRFIAVCLTCLALSAKLRWTPCLILLGARLIMVDSSSWTNLGLGLMGRFTGR